MTFTTTSGKPLAEETMSEVLELCDLVLDLHEAKNKIFVYIEEQMSLLAPNVSALVGTHIAARLIGLVGGLEALSRMPGCNVMIIGSVENKMATGLVSFGSKHRGIVFQSDLVQSAPSDLQRKILKIVSSKIVLAARVDVSKETDLSSSSEFKGEVGLKFRGDIEKKIIKMQEPPPKKQKKALPIPLEKPRKKRGGAKYRRMKERFQITDLQKQKNRMAFNRADDDDYGGEIEMGLLGSADSGRVRIAAQDTQRLSKAAERKLKKQQAKYSSNNRSTAFGSGLATSLTFTASQGLELADPTATPAPGLQSGSNVSSAGPNNSRKYFKD
eukprot:TRINITY_DN13981_c0_g1_i3.p1 TRINITY_DN13981_c0_g1~~TRINITY_DN13981_c0_g1_i3.p1  ORF type:complete len:328 (-),score=96.06 TRINITY_DN13981_c0_g1_i3:31-1014(-)